ncbi:hypothetical protein L3Y34_017724 [Caenorhabditis briggsae]|uniref:Uncharacterized protein n=2 Tax=Caenorhabditis briggsae TaxID=6238 RepID=A0AAE9DKL4_CAEBR|nr:hypothetical protein L3Y34_017724 [Caenorhabditis briggsae]
MLLRFIRKIMTAKEDTLPERLRFHGVHTNILWRNLISEFFGTFLLCFIGLSIVFQFHAGGGKTTEWIGVNIGWGFAIMFAVMATARMSGGHLNPAVSLLLWSLGHLKLAWVPLYAIAQTAGAFVASLAMYSYYYEQFDAFDGGNRSILGATGTAGCFASYPSPNLGVWGPYIDQCVGTGVLAYFLCVVIDERNQIPKIWHPMFFGFLVMMIGTGFGMNIGYPINPARDLGPRLFSYFIYGPGVFHSPYPNYWIAPALAPFVGALVGGWFYHLSLGMHNPDIEETEDHAVQESPKSAEQQKLLQA